MKSILLCDDQEVARVKLRMRLQQEGYEVIEAIDGFDGLEKLRVNPDIVLLVTDFYMPNMDGITFCERVATEHKAKIPMIIVTTETSSEMKKRARKCGVTAWICKPYDLEDAIHVIKEIIRDS